jgi:hypothetical protein
MNGRYRVIDEVSFNLLGTFGSRGDAIDYVAALLAVNDDAYLDELTIASDEGTPLTGNSLRNALRNRAAARERAGATTGGKADHDGGTSSIETITAKGRK